MLKSEKYTIVRMDLRGTRDVVLGVATKVQVLAEMEKAGDFAYEKDHGIVVLDPENPTLAIPHDAEPFDPNKEG